MFIGFVVRTPDRQYLTKKGEWFEADHEAKIFETRDKAKEAVGSRWEEIDILPVYGSVVGEEN